MNLNNLFVDLFCGAGGVTSGIHEAVRRGQMIAEVVACVNHDKNAIRSHAANFPNALHLTEDIRTVALKPIIDALRARKAEIAATAKVLVHLWASLECINFSRAKGGMSRDADSRTLAEHLFRYIKSLKPDYIWIENVEEFMDWGPLKVKELAKDLKNGIEYPHCPLNIIKDKKKKKKIIGYGPVMVPIKEKIGIYYNKWIRDVKAHGYHFEYRILNSADYGANTSRKRYFACFAKIGLPISWPQPTHAKNPEKNLFGSLQKWRPVKDCLNFDLEGESIFSRKKHLSDKTFERIYAGLIKYVAGGKKAFLTKMHSSHNNTRVNSGADVDNPSPTITTFGGINLVQPHFIVQRNSCEPFSKVKSVEDPARTLTSTDGNQELVNIHFLNKYHGKGENIIGMDESCSTLSTKDRLGLINAKYLVNYHHSSDVNSINDPCPTITTKDKYAVVQPEFWLDKTYSGPDNHSAVDAPAGSILSNDKHYLMRAEHFIDRQFSEGGKNSSVEDPAGSITTVPKMNLVKYWIMNTNFNNVGSSIEDPAHTITANRKHHYLINPAWGGHPGDVEMSCCTIVARQDKAPLYLVKMETGIVAIAIYEDDTKIMVKVKEFMAMYNITDIKMRMLEIIELLLIQGFKPDYVLMGTKTEKKKYIGNSVPPKVVKALVEAIYDSLENHFKMKIAA
jgi:DNA (cytosine-5)-methyltransferase 1